MTVTANVLHSINNIEIQTEDIKTHNMPNSNLSESINYDANEIIKRISNGIPISMPAMLREWNGYKH